MAIQMRRGRQADFDPTQLLPGELAVSQDAQKIYMCFSPGLVIEIPAMNNLNEIIREIQSALSTLSTAVSRAESGASRAEASADMSQSYAVGTGGEVRTGDATDNSKYYKEQAEITYGNIMDVIDEITPAFTLDFTTGHLLYTI